MISGTGTISFTGALSQESYGMQMNLTISAAKIMRVRDAYTVFAGSYFYIIGSLDQGSD